MIYKAVIFDLDGTLFNSINDITDSCNKVLLDAGFNTHHVSKYIEWIGNGAYKLVERSLPEEYKDEKTITDFQANFLTEYAANYNNKSHLYLGVSKILDYLSTMKISMSILSNKPHTLTEKIAKEYFNNWDFQLVYGQRNNFPKKPDPKVAKLIANEIGVPLSEILYVGDSVTDIETAKNAGMISVGVSWGYSSKEALINSNPDYLNDTPVELIKLLQLLNN